MSAAKVFDTERSTLDEFNRELKRLASRKCRAKTKADRTRFENEYKQLVKIKNERFGTNTRGFLYLTPDQIAELSLQDLVRGLNSIRSTRSVYPSRKAECLEVEALYNERITFLKAKAEYDRLKGLLDD